MRQFRSISTNALLRAISGFLLGLVTFSAHAGGIQIDLKTLRFDGIESKRAFEPRVAIELYAHGRHFAYSGKPFQYAVFVLYRLEKNGGRTRVGRFVAPVPKEHFEVKPRFALPDSQARYELHCHEVPFFAFAPLASAQFGGFLNAQEEAQVDQFYKDPMNYVGTAKLAEFSTGKAPRPPAITIYPVERAQALAAIDAGKPPTFKWQLGPESSPAARNVQFSYRLEPVEGWSPYSGARQVAYTNLPPGMYTFELRGRYTLDGREETTEVLTVSFTVRKLIFEVAKSDAFKPAPARIDLSFRESLAKQRSRALLVGIQTYDDSAHFKPLPFVRNDLTVLAAVLQRKGFEITVLTSDSTLAESLKAGSAGKPAAIVKVKPTTKANIEEELSALRKTSGPNDRVIVYFSGHGASDGPRAYLAGTDCISSDKARTCISLEQLKSEWIDPMMSIRNVQHLLVILDACQSGLGVMSKSADDVGVATLDRYPSAHMMTAGLVEQDAVADASAQMSVFTKFLVEGLGKEADYTKDGAITLSELSVFVHDKVSKYVAEKFQLIQTPAIGKVKGNGEMVFLAD